MSCDLLAHLGGARKRRLIDTPSTHNIRDNRRQLTHSKIPRDAIRAVLVIA